MKSQGEGSSGEDSQLGTVRGRVSFCEDWEQGRKVGERGNFTVSWLFVVVWFWLFVCVFCFRKWQVA